MGRKKMSLRCAVAILRLVAADDLSSGRAIDGQNEAAPSCLKITRKQRKSSRTGRMLLQRSSPML